MDNKVGPKDILSYLLAAGVLVVAFWITPSVLPIKLVLGGILAVAAFTGLQLIIHPKSAEERRQEEEKDQFEKVLDQSLAIAKRIGELGGKVTRSPSRGDIAEISDTTARIVGKYRSRANTGLSEVKSLNRLMVLFQTVIEAYVDIFTGVIALNHEDKATQLQQAHEITIPKMVQASRQLEINVDAHRTNALDVAESVLLQSLTGQMGL